MAAADPLLPLTLRNQTTLLSQQCTAALAVPHLLCQHQSSQRQQDADQLVEVLRAAIVAKAAEAFHYFVAQLGLVREAREAAQPAFRDLVLAPVKAGEVGMVGDLLDSGLLQPWDPAGALLQAAVVPCMMAAAPSMVEVLLRHGMPITLLAVDTAVWHLNDKALEVLLAAGRLPVPPGSEEEPEHWRGADEHCPPYNLLTSPPWATRARTAELLLAAGYRPVIYRHLVISLQREGGWQDEDEEVVVHLRDFCPVDDLVAAQPALRARMRDADRCVPVTMASVS